MAGSLTGKVPAIAGKALDDVSVGSVSPNTRPEALLQSTATKAEPDSPLPPSTARKPATPTTEALAQLLDNAEKNAVHARQENSDINQGSEAATGRV